MPSLRSTQVALKFSHNSICPICSSFTMNCRRFSGCNNSTAVSRIQPYKFRAMAIEKEPDFAPGASVPFDDGRKVRRGKDLFGNRHYGDIWQSVTLPELRAIKESCQMQVSLQYILGFPTEARLIRAFRDCLGDFATGSIGYQWHSSWHGSPS